jgi:hypothetical protein
MILSSETENKKLSHGGESEDLLLYSRAVSKGAVTIYYRRNKY